MKIKQEQFNKLNQLDRIEFRQKQDRIKDIYSASLNVEYFIMLIMFLFIIDIFLSFRAGYWVISLKTHVLVLQIVLICFLINLAHYIFNNILEVKKLKELQEEYFKIEVRRKK